MASPISLQLYSVRDQLAQDLPRTIAEIAQLGFRQVEPYQFVERADAYRRALHANHLVAPSAHAHLLSLADAGPTFEAAADLGVDVVVDPAVPAEQWSRDADVLETADRLNALSDLAARYGLKVGYHNHDWEFQPLGEGTTYDRFVECLSPDVVLEVDTYWACTAGVDTPGLLRRLGSRVGFVHLKDGPFGWDVKAQVPLGGGLLPLQEILEATPEAVRVVEFDDYAGDVMHAIQESLAVLTARGVTT